MAIKVNVGTLIKDAVKSKKNKYTRLQLADMLGITRGQFNVIINNPVMKIQYAVKFGEIFNCDFVNTAHVLPTEVEELRILLVNIQNKYIALLEENKRLMACKSVIHSEVKYN